MDLIRTARPGFVTMAAAAILALVASLALVAAPARTLDDAAVLGAWDCLATGDTLPPDGVKFSMSLRHNDDGVIVGTISAEGMGDFAVDEGMYDAESGIFVCAIVAPDGVADLEATVDGQSMSGSISAPDMDLSFTGKRPS